MGDLSELNIIHLTDLHGADFLIEEIAQEMQEASLIIISGDITHFGDAKDAEVILNKILSINPNILAVAGNCDYPDVDHLLSERGINLNSKLVNYAGVQFTGCSGSLPCPTSTPIEFTEQEASLRLKEMSEKIDSNNPFIFVPHHPPSETKNDKLSDGKHIGSKAIRNFIEYAKPILCLTGHIHEGIGTDKIEDCYIVNPGPFRTGKYAIIKINGENSVNVSIRQITA